MKQRSTLKQILGIEHPILLAPMFLISNAKMVIEALKCGCTAAIPALNYRTEKELRAAIREIRQASSKPFGINLIVNKSNPKYKSQLLTLLELKVDFIITSLGNPKEVITACKPLGIKVFCDVTDVRYAIKVEQLGADAIIAVNSKAGGHCGDLSAKELISQLIQSTTIPIISAGGIMNKMEVAQMMEWGAAGVSVGTIFIATHEANVSQEYKQAMIQFGSKDIVKTSKLTGSPLTVINTSYVQRIGTKSNLWEWLINNSSVLKKYAKLILAWQGMNKVKKSAFKASYQNVWCAGPSIEAVKSIRSVPEVIKDLI
ncbi:NAD(P)H-dependent flavin oxidoreductase [Labilibaculum antarcticum]|uniref:2-nitropropane dioxygenase n=1 Tax=Labilibaculum antarcticum TaxID=1717717 RepID=A0A1Y1CPG9_9BACT|nr:nitronate monooxygenase [Labilibaculum antarcticum]BAX82338.1 2-nitropropane dioxygenase [Labilibaculum antarcticum]